MLTPNHKRKNRTYLKRVYFIKRSFLPLLLAIDKMGLVKPLEKGINSLLRLAGIHKDVHYFFKYKDFARLFTKNFLPEPPGQDIILFPMQTSVNGNIPLINLLFSRYFNRYENLKPVFLVCDAALPICSKDGILKSRLAHPLFCQECWRGYPHISELTGIDIKYFSDFLKGEDDRLKDLQLKLDEIKTLQDCEDICFGDLPVGKLCRKSVLRYLLRGKFSGSEEEVSIFRSFISSVSHYSFMLEAYLDSNPQIKYMIIHNGTLAFEASARWHATKRGIPYMTYETFLGQNSLIYKKNGEVMTLDWSERYNSFLENFALDEKARYNADSFFYDLRRGTILHSVLNTEHTAKKFKGIGQYACLFTNLNFDTAVLDRNGIFESMEDWIYSVIDYWENEINDLKLVIRIHPAEIKLITASTEFMADKLKSHVVNSEKIIIIEPNEKVNSYELIKDMEFGLVYSSTIGLEIAYHEKVCVVAGLPYFKGKPFLLSPSSSYDYFSTIKALCLNQLSFSIDRDELIRTINFIYFNRMKKLNGIKVYTPMEEPVTDFISADDMINANLDFFNDFRDELFSE